MAAWIVIVIVVFLLGLTVLAYNGLVQRRVNPSGVHAALRSLAS